MVCCLRDRDTQNDVSEYSMPMMPIPRFQTPIPDRDGGRGPVVHQPLTTPKIYSPIRFQEPDIQRPQEARQSWRGPAYQPPHSQTIPIFPSAVHQVWGASPSPIRPSPPRETQFTGQSVEARPGNRNEKLTVSIDFGSTFAGVAYGSPTLTNGQVKVVLNWPDHLEKYRKIPTALLYDAKGAVIAWGLAAAHSAPDPGQFICRLFKLFLDSKNTSDNSAIDDRLPKLPPGKRPVDLITDYLRCIWRHCREEIVKDLSGDHSAVAMADIWLMVPQTWGPQAIQMMREAAFNAMLVAPAYPHLIGDTDWKDRLLIMTEPQAASIHCASIVNNDTSTLDAVLEPGLNFMVCDAGGGSVDIAVHKLIGQLSDLEIAEISAQTGSMCGSFFLDLRFRELVKVLLEDHPVHRDSTSLQNFGYNFSEVQKLTFGGGDDDDEMFYFPCFNVEDQDDAAVGLINGSLSVPGTVLQRHVFDPVIEEVISLIRNQVEKLEEPIHTLFMVGGFSENPYLLKRIKECFDDVFRVILRPRDADTAALRGAVKYGMGGVPLISSVVAPHSYVMKVRQPADPEDQINRPNYISRNAAGILICEKRLQYLILKGTIVKKGERIRTKFSKFSKDAKDSNFSAILYTTDGPEILRYIDQGHLTPLCKWNVELQSLPSFQRNAKTPSPVGFYTGESKRLLIKDGLLLIIQFVAPFPFTFFDQKEFEVGLELDSAEVRGVLLYNGEECGRAVFDFLT